MKKMLAAQITAFIILGGVFGALAINEGVYETVQETIVNVLCLSCLKLTPTNDLNFTFSTANGEDHPSFIVENLSKGVVFLVFRADVCAACDIMEPSVQEIFDVDFEKEDTVMKTIQVNDVNVTLLHINIDHSPQQLIDLYDIYDQHHIGGVPMFTVISYGYNRGTVLPIYATGYGTLQGETSQEQQQALENMIFEGTLLYTQNHHGSHH